MARKQQPRRRPPSVPAPAGSAAYRPADSSAPRRYPATAPGPAPVSASEDLSESYAYVRRDLTRIVILGALLLAGIFLSQFIML